MQEGRFECLTCGCISKQAESILSQPCTRRADVTRVSPHKLDLDPKVRLVTFCPDWPAKVQEMIGHRLDENWELVLQDGSLIRLVVSAQGDLCCDRIPNPEDFPVMIGAVSKEQLLQEELVELELQEALLEETLVLEDMERQASQAKVVSSKDCASTTTPSSGVASSSGNLAQSPMHQSMFESI